MKLAIVIKNSFLYTCASVLQGMISFFLLPIYTRYLSPADYAVLALVTAFTGIVSSVITLQINSGIPRFVIKFLNDENRAKNYFTIISLFLLLLLVLSCSLINLFGDGIVKLLFSKNTDIRFVPFFQIATWILLPNLMISSCLSLLQTLEKGKLYLFAICVQVITNVLIGLLLVIKFNTGVIGILWAQLFSAVAGLLAVVWLIRGWIKFKIPVFPLGDIKDSLRYSMPIIPHMLSIYIYMFSDRLILKRFVPMADIGIYSIADTFASVLLLIVNAVNTAYSPRFLKLAQESTPKAKGETKSFIEIWWVGIMVIFMGYLLFSGQIVKLMTRPSFYPCIPLIPILATAYVFRGLYCFSANSIFFTEKTKLIPVITVTAALLNIILNLIFIPKFGIYAAAWNTVFSYCVTFVLAYYFSAKQDIVKYPWLKMANITILMSLVYLTSNTVNRFVNVSFWFQFIVNFSAIIIFGMLAINLTFRIQAINFIKALALKASRMGY